MYITIFWTLWERARVGWYGRMALNHVNYHMWNESPAWCMIQGAQGWCTGMTQRDGMGREMGEGFRMGNTCTPMADSCQCMAKPIQYCKVISLQLKKQKTKNTWLKMFKVSKNKPFPEERLWVYLNHLQTFSHMHGKPLLSCFGK